MKVNAFIIIGEHALGRHQWDVRLKDLSRLLYVKSCHITFAERAASN